MLLLLRTIANAFQEEGRTEAEWLGRVCGFFIMAMVYIDTAEDCGDYRTSTVHGFE